MKQTHHVFDNVLQPRLVSRFDSVDAIEDEQHAFEPSARWVGSAAQSDKQLEWSVWLFQ